MVMGSTTQALHLQEAFADLETPELPVATAAGRRALCLPMFAELTGAELTAVVDAVRGFFA